MDEKWYAQMAAIDNDIHGDPVKNIGLLCDELKKVSVLYQAANEADKHELGLAVEHVFSLIDTQIFYRLKR